MYSAAARFNFIAHLQPTGPSSSKNAPGFDWCHYAGAQTLSRPEAKTGKGDHPISTEENKAQTQQIIEQGWNKGNLDALDELISPDFVNHTPVNPNEDREQFKQRLAMFRTAFPDLVMSVEDMIAEGDEVVTRWRARGTHRGDFRGIPATGREVEITGIAIDRVVNGKRVEGWALLDMLGLLQQLGAIP